MNDDDHRDDPVLPWLFVAALVLYVAGLAVCEHVTDTHAPEQAQGCGS